MEALGADTVLVCSTVHPDSVDDDALAAEQLHALAERAAGRGLRVAYEALAWGRHVSDYEHAWRIVEAAGHPSLGVCLDSFHILSRGSDPAGIRAIPAEKLFFLQLADAPHLHMDVLQWSRHFRCFPGQGAFDLTGFCGHVLAAGYHGPLSLEVFNDVFRQADPGRTAVDAMRSLLVLEDELGLGALPAAPGLRGYAFAELAVGPGSAEDAERILGALGFRHVGPHRSKPVQRWDSGAARVLLNHGDEHERGRRGAGRRERGRPRLGAPCRGAARPGPRAAAQPRRGGPRGGRRPGRDLGVLRRRRRGVALGLRRARRRRCRRRCRCSRSTTSRCRSRSTPSTRRSSSTGRCWGWSRGPARISRRPTGSCAAGRSATARSAWRSTSPCSARRTSLRTQHVAFRCEDVLAVARAMREQGAASAADPGQPLRRPPGAARSRSRAPRRAARAARPVRPRRARRHVPALLHAGRRAHVLRGRRAPRRLRRLRRGRRLGPHGRAATGGVPAAPPRLT